MNNVKQQIIAAYEAVQLAEQRHMEAIQCGVGGSWRMVERTMEAKRTLRALVDLWIH